MGESLHMVVDKQREMMTFREEIPFTFYNQEVIIWIEKKKITLKGIAYEVFWKLSSCRVFAFEEMSLDEKNIYQFFQQMLLIKKCEKVNYYLNKNVFYSVKGVLNTKTWEMVELNTEEIEYLRNNDFLHLSLEKKDMLYFHGIIRKTWKYFTDICQDKTYNVYVIFSYRCNMNCIYCFEKGKRTKSRLSSRKLDEVLEFLYTNDCMLTLYGGEPLLERDCMLGNF